MVLRLRLARVSTPGGARRHAPLYNIVLAHARTARDSLPLEVLGTYNPIPKLPAGYSESDVKEGKARKAKDIKVDVARAKYWLGVGAQPSDTVWRLLSMIGLLEPKYLPTGPQTEKALKAVRFPTHLPNSQASTSREGAVMEAIKEAAAAKQA
ncbi:hypothetical protein LTR62_006494 [Meristemomyces frigidus]|uniref:Ribosomal protein S16 n=1 Tax=Meristemomyces frigidus TaxID=1508187 RepID=A0AAN7YMV2_9PEZI|nr:hypothetical protein LTR62_006494 [Meristemomyces frigidus]